MLFINSRAITIASSLYLRHTSQRLQDGIKQRVPKFHQISATDAIQNNIVTFSCKSIFAFRDDDEYDEALTHSSAIRTTHITISDLRSASFYRPTTTKNHNYLSKCRKQYKHNPVFRKIEVAYDRLLAEETYSELSQRVAAFILSTPKSVVALDRFFVIYIFQSIIPDK